MTTFPQPDIAPEWPLEAPTTPHVDTLPSISIQAARKPNMGCKWKPGTPAHDKHCVPEPSTAILLAISAAAALICRRR